METKVETSLRQASDNAIRGAALDEANRRIERVCGNCAFFTGEECDGAYEGEERYDDSESCASFEPNATGQEVDDAD